MVNYEYHRQEVHQSGFTVIDDIYTRDEVVKLLELINDADQSNPTFRKTNDLFAIRQFLKQVPEIKSLILTNGFKKLIRGLLGDGYFIVKSIYSINPKNLIGLSHTIKN